MFTNLNSASHSYSQVTPKIQGSRFGNLPNEVAAAYAGDAYAKEKLLDIIRGGGDLAQFKIETFAAAAFMAQQGKSGFTLNLDRSIYTKAGRGKTMSNDFSMAAAAAKICLPEYGEKLSTWHSRATKPTKAAVAPDSGTDTVDRVNSNTPVIPESGSVAPTNIGVTRTPPPHTPTVPESGTTEQATLQAARAATVDNVGELVALIDDTLADDELDALIFELKALQVKRNQVKLAA